MKKQKLDELTQAKLIYTIELGVFVAIFLTLGILFILSIIPMTERRYTIFTYVTLIGGFIGIGDFVWVLASKKRRKKNSILDKALLVPLSLTLMSIDVFSLAKGWQSKEFYSVVLGSAFLYIATAYLIELVYHWFKPIPMLLDAGDKIKAAEEADAKVEEKPVETTNSEPEKTENHDKQ